MLPTPTANLREFYLEVSITNAPQGLEKPTTVEPSEARPTLGEISKALHEVAEQILEGAPIGNTAVSDSFVASWQFGETQDDLDRPGDRSNRRPKTESRPEPSDRVEPDNGRADDFEESEITEVRGFRIPRPQQVAWSSTRKNARPIYRYFPFVPGKTVGLGSWQTAARALKVFSVLHAAHRGPEGLELDDLLPLFFRSSSDLITYREGWKAGRFWSVEAFKKAVSAQVKHTNGLISEHVMPRSQTLIRALEIEDAGKAAEFVWNNSFECVVTADENNELTGQDKKRPKREPWIFEKGPWERYSGTSIRVLDVTCNGQAWLSQEDREALQDLDLIAKWDESLIAYAAPQFRDQWKTYVPREKREDQ